MSRRTFTVVAAVLLLLGAAIRVHNALTFPVLGSYDAFGHFTYVWYVGETWRVPLPTSGWEFFHPPLYYAVMAAIWTGLAGTDPVLRLRMGLLIVAVASLVHAAVVWDIIRRRFPADRLLRLLAGGLTLFLPVHLYSAAFLGNEGLTAVLCSIALLLLLARLRRQTWTRSMLLGLVLGLAMLTKITAVAVVAGAIGMIALKALHERRLRAEGVHLAVILGVLLATCGWYYARNVERYGTPFVMSRNELMLRIVESSQPQAQRSLAEYLLFDPMIFRRPAWPRSVGDETEPHGWSRALRESVWTGLYANTWFDGFGGWAVPRVTDSELARRAGQALLVLGTVPTLLVLVGVWSAIVQFRRKGWDDLLVATLLTLGTMLVIFVVGTRVVPIAAAVKATYLMPVTVTFGVCFALGLARLRAWRPAAVRVVTAELALLGAISVAVFWHGLLFDAASIRGYFPMIEASEENLYGVVYYAAGERGAARRHFQAAAAGGLYLGYENLALLALDERRPGEALHLLKRAMRLQPAQSFGLPAERAAYDRTTRAEYLNLTAVISHMQGRPERARRAAAAALRLDLTIPEAHYDLAVVTLERALDDPQSSPPAADIARARQHLDRALALDPGFAEARELLAVARSLEGECAAEGTRDGGSVVSRERTVRIYPVETGTGAPYAASIARRRHISDLPERLRIEPAPQPAAAESAAPRSRDLHSQM